MSKKQIVLQSKTCEGLFRQNIQSCVQGVLCMLFFYKKLVNKNWQYKGQHFKKLGVVTTFGAESVVGEGGRDLKRKRQTAQIIGEKAFYAEKLL